MTGRGESIGPCRHQLSEHGAVVCVALTLCIAFLLLLAPSNAAATVSVAPWAHELQVVSWVRSRPPSASTVYLFGGSSAREAIVSESSWSAALTALVHTPVSAWVMANSNQTYQDDIALAAQLPAQRGLAVIGVGLGGFTRAVPARAVVAATRSTPPAPWLQHAYDQRPRQSAAAKRAMVGNWLRGVGPMFTAAHEAELQQLDALIAACKGLGLSVVLVEAPTNVQAIGGAFNAYRQQYQPECAALAAQYGIQYVRFNARIGLVNGDFYDLDHLLRSGSAKWQAALSQEIAARGLLTPPAP